MSVEREKNLKDHFETKLKHSETQMAKIQDLRRKKDEFQSSPSAKDIELEKFKAEMKSSREKMSNVSVREIDM